MNSLLQRPSVYALLILAVYMPSYAQTYEASLVNRGSFFASAALLQDYDGDGDLDIVVTRKRDLPSLGGMEWLENDATGLFPRHTMVDDLLEPAYFAAGDLDDDGDVDYVVADKGTDGTNGELVVYARQDDDSYMRQALFSDEPFNQVDLEDLDGDGDLDIAAVAFGLDSLYAWINEGDLTFTQTLINENVNQLNVIEAADVDSDGDIDILVNDLLLKNNGSGLFDETQELFTDTGISSAGRDFAVADLDNNGSLDIVTFRDVGLGGMYVLNGSNNFTHEFIDRDGIDLGGSILVSDLDGNGWKDIIRQNFGDDYVAVLYQESAMSFRREILEMHWDNDVRGSQMVLGDLDDDGDEDLIFAEDGNVDGDISWFENISGVLNRHYLYAEIKAARRTRLGDIDGDGDYDIVVGAGNRQGSTAFSEREIVWYENRSGNFFESRIEDDLYFPYDIELADLDGDQMLDVVATGEQDSSLFWYRKNGESWVRSIIDTTTWMPQGIAITDLNADDNTDIVLAAAGDSAVYWYQNEGAGSFTRNVVDEDLPAAMEPETADFNDDGSTDLVVITSDSSIAVAVYSNAGDNTFSREVIFTGHIPTDVEVGDWTGDGAPDILVGFNTRFVDPTQNIVLFTNDGDGVFTPSPLYVANQETILALKLIDADDDGDLDLAFSNENLRPALALLPNEAGIAGTPIVIEENNPHDFLSIDAADIDQDGDVDLVAAGPDSESLYLFTSTEFEPVSVDSPGITSGFALFQNYPNPFSNRTHIEFQLSESSEIQLEVFDLLGRSVRVLSSRQFPPGRHSITFESDALPSGLYFYRLHKGDQSLSKKMIILN